jgi:hypothetical protein
VVADEDVQVPELADHGVDESVRLVWFTQITRTVYHPLTSGHRRFANPRHHRLQIIGAPRLPFVMGAVVRQRQVCAQAGQPSCNREADAPPSADAGHQGHSPRKRTIRIASPGFAHV